MRSNETIYSYLFSIIALIMFYEYGTGVLQEECDRNQNLG